jgi:alkylation response protein AidB-like acyl-CoA dehydrogenase
MTPPTDMIGFGLITNVNVHNVTRRVYACVGSIARVAEGYTTGWPVERYLRDTSLWTLALGGE